MGRSFAGIVSLVGPRGAGKTRVGGLLARRLGLPLRETDALLAARAGTSIAVLFAAQGEEAFRSMEAQVLEEALRSGPCVLATGGGAVLRPRSRRLLRQGTFGVYLTAAPACLLDRVSRDPASPAQRPPLTDLDPLEETRALLRRRDGWYRSCARLVLPTDGRTPEDLAQAIAEALP